MVYSLFLLDQLLRSTLKKVLEEVSSGKLKSVLLTFIIFSKNE